MLDRRLGGFDPGLVSLLAERTRAMGIDLRVDIREETIDRRGDQLVVRAMPRSGPSPPLRGVLHHHPRRLTA